MSDQPEQEHPRQQELRDIVEKNSKLLVKIRKQGAKLSEESINKEQFKFFMDWTIKMVANATDESAIDLSYQFEIAWQHHIHTILKQTDKQVRMEKLTARGHKPKGGIIVPGQGG